jgi:nucleoside-diphosphate-sugar epimerase
MHCCVHHAQECDGCGSEWVMTATPRRILVTGAGGFIGHHLVKRLRADGHWVRGADVKPPEYEPTDANEFATLDLRYLNACLSATRGVDDVYNLAADMGGIGYIGTNRADIARNNSLINLNMLEASRRSRVERFLFSSSACVYAQSRQLDAEVRPLAETDAFPADPEPGYGWEKLYAEQMCEYYRRDHGLETRVARFHNVYGPLGTYDGGREKAPAAICRKIALAREGDELELWGDGEQTRSFMYVDDCIEGILRIMASECREPLNLGSERLISINGLVDLVLEIAGRKLARRHLLDRPQGVRGRNSDNSRLREVLGWEPSIPLEDGLRRTYAWIATQLRQAARTNALKRRPAAIGDAAHHVL